jgi:hypothetical protein
MQIRLLLFLKIDFMVCFDKNDTKAYSIIRHKIGFIEGVLIFNKLDISLKWQITRPD